MNEPLVHRVPAGPSAWRRAAVVGVALTVFAVAAGFAWTVFDRSVREEPITPSDPWSWAPEGWTELPLPPEVRDEAAIVWTGKELVYWGGWPRGASREEPRADGFAFDPQTRTWRTLPPAPIEGGGFEALNDRRAGAKAIWTGSEVVFWDVETGDGTTSATLALEPDSGTWRRLDDPPHRPEWGGAWAWTGRELIVFGGGDRDAPTTVAGAALDPATGAWRRTADSPIGMNLANAAWTGEEVVVVGSELDNRNVAETGTAVALAYDPATDTWRRLPDAPLSPQASEAVWFEDRVFAWDYLARSAQYLPAEDRWQGLGGPSLDHGECYVDGVAIEGAVFGWNCGIPDAWITGVGWTNVEGGPPARQAEVDETYLGSQGRAVGAGSVAIVEQLDNVWIDENLHIGSSEAPVHLWIWRPVTAPQPPRPATAEDAEYLVANFLLAWQGREAYLPTLATQDVIDRCRVGEGGCAPLGEGGFSDWRSGDVIESAPGTFEVRLELRPGVGADVPQTFVVGPGTTADGRVADLLVVDVRPG